MNQTDAARLLPLSGSVLLAPIGQSGCLGCGTSGSCGRGGMIGVAVTSVGRRQRHLRRLSAGTGAAGGAAAGCAGAGAGMAAGAGLGRSGQRQLEIGATESRPTRNARRSPSLRSSTRTMCGVSVRMMSRLGGLDPVVREQPADDREVAQPRDAVEHAPLVVANQPGQHVGFAVPQPDHGVDLAIAERRQVAEAHVPEMLCTATFSVKRHIVVVMQCAA